MSNSSLYQVITEDSFHAYSKKKLYGHQQGKACPLANVSYVAIIIPARKTVNKKTLHEVEEQQQNFWIKITASCLSYELGLHSEKNFNGKFRIL